MENTIELRPIEMKDFHEVFQWSKDEQFCLLNDWKINREEKELYEWWKRCCEFQQSSSFRRFGIEHVGKLIGYADLADIKGKSAEVGVAIGDSTVWGKGIGSHVLKELMDYGREFLAIEEFYAETKATNLRYRNMLEKLGFFQTDKKGGIYYFKISFTGE